LIPAYHLTTNNLADKQDACGLRVKNLSTEIASVPQLLSLKTQPHSRNVLEIMTRKRLRPDAKPEDLNASGIKVKLQLHQFHQPLDQLDIALLQYTS